MSRTHLMTVAALAAITALAFMASATSAGTVQSQRASAAAAGTTQIGAVSVRLRINRFVRRGRHLYAVGTTTAKFAPTVAGAADVSDRGHSEAVRRPRQVDSRLLVRAEDLPGPQPDARAARPEPARPDGAPRPGSPDDHGRLAGRAAGAALVRARRRPWAHPREGGQADEGRAPQRAVHSRPPGGSADLRPASANGATGQGSVSPMFICPILDLTLGPLDLNLLGLMVHLDTVHLVITADSEGGLLGQLLAGLLCGGGGGAPAGAR